VDVDVSLPFSCQQAGEAKTKRPVESFLPAIMWRASQCGWVRIGKTEHGQHDVSATYHHNPTTNSNNIKVESMLKVSNTGFGLPEEIASGLFASATSLCLMANDTLFQSGDTGDGCYRLNSGMLKVIMTSSQGDEQILAILAPGTIVGDLAMIDGLPQPASVVALTDCELCFVSRTAFEHFASQNAEIYRYLVKVLTARLRQADKHIASLAFLSAKGRVAYALLEIAETLGKHNGSGEVLIPRMITQKGLAAMARVARENVNRVLHDFQRSKVVSRSSEAYRIDDRAKLERAVAW
jgi:CRP/FNR family transcriptional regulator, cyclic AMP receptor protein